VDTTLNFYNQHHAGDLHVSKEFVRYVVSLGLGPITYWHNYDHVYLADIKGLIQRKLPPGLRLNFMGHHTLGGKTFINTWYRVYDCEYFSLHSVTLITLHKIMERTFLELMGLELPSIKMYVPDILNIGTPPTLPHPSVLICNNQVLSDQVKTFDWDGVIKALSTRYPQADFIVTNGTVVKAPNVISSPWKGWPNMINIVRTSLACKAIVGSNSGPWTYCLIKPNVEDRSKLFVSVLNKESSEYGDPAYWHDFGIRQIYERDCARFELVHNENDVVEVLSGIGG